MASTVADCYSKPCLTVCVAPQVDTLYKVRSAICGGDLNFVFAVDGLGSVAWSFPHAVSEERQADLKNEEYYELYKEGLQDWLDGDPDQLNMNEFVLDTIIQGKGRGPCPTDICYAPIPGAGAPAPRPNRPRCGHAFGTCAAQPRMCMCARARVRVRVHECTCMSARAWNCAVHVHECMCMCMCARIRAGGCGVMGRARARVRVFAPVSLPAHHRPHCVRNDSACV